MSVVEITQIKKDFGHLPVLKGFDLSLEAGEVLGLFGHNGAGKTTSMKLILGLLKPSAGEVKVFGQDPCHADFSHHRYQLGFLPENVSFYPQLTGFEVLHFFARLKKVTKKRCLDLLDQVGLIEASGRKVKTYSKGMKQRLGLAQALLTEPSLLLLDEPTVGLDPIATQEFYRIVDQLKSKGCSLLLCSHVLPGVERHIDKAAILNQGQLNAFGSMSELRQQARLLTQIRFKGCFNLDELAKRLGHPLYRLDDGHLALDIEQHQKLAVIERLMAQPGLQDLDTRPPSLEQLYRHFIEAKNDATNENNNLEALTLAVSPIHCEDKSNYGVKP